MRFEVLVDGISISCDRIRYNFYMFTYVPNETAFIFYPDERGIRFLTKRGYKLSNYTAPRPRNRCLT